MTLSLSRINGRVNSSNATYISLSRHINLLQACGILLGLMVGTGIYITPQTILLYTHSAGLSLVFWAFGGVFSLLGAFCWSEIGVRYPFSGEKYIYMQILYGPKPSFVFLMQYLLLIRPASNSLKSLIISRYIVKAFFLNCEVPEIATFFLSTAAIS